MKSLCHLFRLKYAAIVVVMWAGVVTAGAQPTFAWVRAGITGSHCNGQSVAVDEAGNSWVAGRMYGNADFWTTNFSSYGGTWDGFLAKYSAGGGLLWVKSVGGYSQDEAQAVAVDSSGNAYVHGFYNGTAFFDSTNLTATTGHEGFLAKYDTNGAAVWAIRCGGNGPGAWGNVAVDGQQNIYVSGAFNGQGTFGNTNFNSVGGYNPFVMKLNPSGEMLWVRTFGGRGHSYGRALAVDAAGNVVLTGGFTDALMFGERCLFSRGGEDIFLVKLDASGGLLWSHSTGDGNQESSYAAAFDPAGNIYVGGSFNSSVNFGITNLTSQGGQECFLAKYDPAGNVTWALSFPGNSDDAINSLAIDRWGSVHVAGQSHSSPLQTGSTNLPHYGGYDAFAAKLSPEGATLWASRLGMGGGNHEYGYGLGLDASGNVHITGQFSYGFPIGTTNLYNPSGGGMFIAKFTRDLPVITTQPVPATVLERAALAVSVTATGTGPFRYQWSRDGVNLHDATNATLSFSSIATNQAGRYRVEVANYEGAVLSDIATVSVLTIGTAADTTDLVWSSGGNAIWIHQTDVTHDGVDAMRSGAITNAQQTWMQTEVVGPARLSFQWKISCENGYDFLRFSINGFEVTNTSGKVDWKPVSLLLASGTNTLRWSYTKDDSESVGQDAGWVDQISIIYAPGILAGPISQVVTAGMNTTFSATVGGMPPFQYIWRHNGNILTGATNAALIVAGVTSAEEGSYGVTVVNPGGVAVSTAATLTVLVPPPITSLTNRLTAGLGESVMLSVIGARSGELTYQWRFNDVEIPGATSATLLLANVQPGAAGLYVVIVSSPSGGAISQSSHVTAAALAMRPAMLVAGALGQAYRIEYAERLAPTNWVALTNFVLPYSPYHHVDFTAEGHPKRFYRVISE